MAAVRGRALVALLAALLVTVTGCTVGPSERPPVAVRGENMPVAPTPEPTVEPGDAALPPLLPQQAVLPFLPCTAEDLLVLGATPAAGLRAECAELPVDADPQQPAAGITTLSVVRIGPTGTTLDRPPLLVLGDTVAGPTAGHALTVAAQLAPELLEAFTVIGLDRRGAGADLLGCAPPLARSALIDISPAATSTAQLEVMLTSARAVNLECNIVEPSALAGYRSTSSASDVSLLRTALGVPQLAAVGSGDGAAALAQWARTMPQEVARLVLDGPPDPGVLEPDATTTRAATTDAAFDAFALACGATCPLGADARTTVAGLVARLTTQPLAVADGRRLTAGGLTTVLIDGLSRPAGWPTLATALAAAVAGDAVAVLDLLAPLSGSNGAFDGRLAVTCNDRRTRLDPASVSTLATELSAEHPLFGATLAQRLIACAPWATGGPAPDWGTADGLVPALVIGTAADPRAPLEESRAVAMDLPEAVFVTWQGAGTGAYPTTPCVTGLVDRLLLQAQLPTPGSLCPP